jgi:hypothetical protein
MNITAGFIFAALALIVQLTAAIHGVLTDASGALIPGAAVSLSGANVRVTVQTAADGSYAFQGLAAGDYTLSVTVSDLETFEKRVRDDGVTIDGPIQLRPHVETQALTITEAREAEIGLEEDKSAAAVIIKSTDLDALPDNPDDLLNMLQTLAGQGAGSAQIPVDNFSGSQFPSKNTIKEVKINQDPFSALTIGWVSAGSRSSPSPAATGCMEL